MVLRVVAYTWRLPLGLYLPIMSVNALLIIALGGLVGLLSGMFGVGGGFLTTPLLIFYGIPPTVAVASATTQITGSTVSGVYAHMRRGGVDLKMGGVMIAGGVIGSLTGAGLFRLLQNSGPDRPGHRLPLRAAARLDRRPDAQGRAGRAGLGRRSPSEGSGRGTIAGSRGCRCAGASMPRASTCRRWRRWRWASSPGS